ncbi:hypothetical protein JKF63_05994 [Porcisia hertigi]|uniref:DUF1935 domain-containing protein n=1 Tax=Porcisia hertigi TaxID=2761500 RepID=A0A836I8A4_9TRYP|nr:hypothetical protein JKF63_05994 [Porcisia hertigi]
MGCRGSKGTREVRATPWAQGQVSGPEGGQGGQSSKKEALPQPLSLSPSPSPLLQRQLNGIPKSGEKHTSNSTSVSPPLTLLRPQTTTRQPALNLLVATAPAEENSEMSLSEEGEVHKEHTTNATRKHRSHNTSLHQESQIHRVVKGGPPYAGPGPAVEFPIDRIYRCFDEGNGLLFRLVNDACHMWAFYNDTAEYMMRVSVTFGPGSSIEALGNARQTMLNEETGECRLEMYVAPGETLRFLRGEYNGFITCYDANLIHDVRGVDAHM